MLLFYINVNMSLHSLVVGGLCFSWKHSIYGKTSPHPSLYQESPAAGYSAFLTHPWCDQEPVTLFWHVFKIGQMNLMPYNRSNLDEVDLQSKSYFYLGAEVAMLAHSLPLLARNNPIHLGSPMYCLHLDEEWGYWGGWSPQPTSVPAVTASSCSLLAFLVLASCSSYCLYLTRFHFVAAHCSFDGKIILLCL